MSNLLIFCMLAGIIAYAVGLGLCTAEDNILYCEELGYKGDLKHWKNYAKSLTDSQPMRKELELMDKQQFMTEMYLLYKLTLTEV